MSGGQDYRSARRALARLALRLAGGDRELATGLLAAAAETVGQAERSAWITLAGVALNAAGGDEKEAAVMLRPVLEAAGALPYQAAPGKYRYGAAG